MMFERWDDERLEKLRQLHTGTGADHIRACYAHMDAQQAKEDEMAVRLHAEIEQLKGAMEAAIDKWMTEFGMRENAEKNQEYAEFKLAKAQYDLAAHALALKETKQELQDLSYRAWLLLHPTMSMGRPNEIDFARIGRMSLEASIEHIKAFLARPLSSYQQRAERLEALAKAAKSFDEYEPLLQDMTEQGLLAALHDALSDLGKAEQ